MALRRLSTSTAFIARAKAAESATVLLGPFTSAGRFDGCLERAGMQCVSIGDGAVRCELIVNEELSNNYGTLHGGAISTIVDVVGTMALLSIDPSRAGVSIEMNQTFCNAAKVGERVVMLGSVPKYGRSLGFTEVTIRRGEPSGADGAVVALGRHTKMFPS